MNDWLPIATAPKDGTPVELRAEDEGPFRMYWDATASNALVSTHAGIWVLVGGGLTWCDERPEGAPTHWRPIVRIDVRKVATAAIHRLVVRKQ